MAQQAEADSYPAQHDHDKPGRDHHQGDRRDIDAEEVDVRESHEAAPASK